MIFKIINFLIFLGLLYFFTRKGVRAAFISRSEQMKKLLLEAANIFESASKKVSEAENRLKNSSKEIEKMTHDFEMDAKEEKERMVEQAKNYSSILISETKKSIESEKLKAISKIKEEIAKISVEIAKDKLAKELTGKDHIKFVERAINVIEI